MELPLEYPKDSVDTKPILDEKGGELNEESKSKDQEKGREENGEEVKTASLLKSADGDPCVGSSLIKGKPPQTFILRKNRGDLQ